MILSKADLSEYIRMDMQASRIKHSCRIKQKLGNVLCPSIAEFTLCLRKLEYMQNCRRRNILENIIFVIRYKRFVAYGYKLGFTIPLNVCGTGLCLGHVGTVIINEHARIGRNARICAGVNIGNSAPLGEGHVDDNVPIIGDNVYIGPGAKLFGRIHIGNNVRIGANAVVNKDVPDNVTVAGVPARIVSHHGSHHGLEI